MTTITTYSQVRAGTYRIDPAGSRISFTLRNRLGIFPIRGTFDVREGTVEIPVEIPGEIPAEPGAATVRAVVDTASFHTSIRRRDDDVRSSRFLDVVNYPDLVFTGQATDDGTAVVGRVERQRFVTGATLSLTGAEATEDGYVVSATSRVDRCALGVAAARAAGQYLDLELRVVLLESR